MVGFLGSTLGLSHVENGAPRRRVCRAIPAKGPEYLLQQGTKPPLPPGGRQRRNPRRHRSILHHGQGRPYRPRVTLGDESTVADRIDRRGPWYGPRPTSTTISAEGTLSESSSPVGGR
jgi:hypothetical protein